jgi:small subunit ribosomal protein S6
MQYKDQPSRRQIWPNHKAITSAREYETIYVLRPDAGREASESISTRVLDVMTKQRGCADQGRELGLPQARVPGRRARSRVYVYLKYLGDGALVRELERNLRLQDAVLKFQTVSSSKW